MAENTNRLRRKIFSLCEEFFEQTHAHHELIPGKDYLPATAKLLHTQDLIALVDASLDLWLTTGRYAKDFETQLSQRLFPAAKVLLVNSGSSANLVAVSSLGAPKPGDEIITVAAAFPTTVNPLFQNQWVPVFVDVDEKTMNALPEKIMEAQTSRTRAVILAHTLGNPYRADILKQWCQKEGLFFIEDCCDALGATIDNQPVGSFGHFSTFSFYPAHQITMGEGGAVICHDHMLAKIAKSFRDWGRDCWCETGKDNTCGKRFNWSLGDLPEGYDHKYIYSNIGYNLKLTDMQAAIGYSQLSHLNEFVEKRRANFNFLREGIKSSPLLSQKLIPIKPTAGTNPSWFGFAMYCADGISRNKLVRFLENNKTGTRMVFAGNLTKQPAYKDKIFRVHGSLQNTDKIMNQAFWIGVHPRLGKAQLAYILEQLEAGVKK